LSASVLDLEGSPFLTLDYLGLGDRTSVLDGGFGAWTSDDGAVTKEIPVVTRGTLTVHPRTDVIVDGRVVRGAIGDGRVALKPCAALEAALDAAGATPGKRLIAYCATGQQASVVYLVGRLLGRDVQLYDRSWDDWSQRAEHPVESGRGASR
jgi:thiosulfate/3-mercaptopyruvate sulfurtransferase